jgi:tetratricopeptide (TPR) repeat protein
VRASLRWSLIAFVPIIAVGAGFLLGRSKAHTPSTAAPCVSELAPSADAIRYRFAVKATSVAAADSEIDSIITAFEARMKDKLASPFDLADLADAYYRRAQLTGDSAGYDRAEELAKASLAVLPFPNGVVIVQAKIANAKHNFREAIRIAHEMLSHKPSVGALTVLASAHLALGELDSATDAAEKAVALKPDSASYLMRALVLQASGRDAEASFDFARSCALEVQDANQESARARVLWGRFLLRRGELAGAAMLFTEALRIVPDFPLALANQAELALRRGDFKAARIGFERAFATSRQVRYLIDVARAQELAGDSAGADNARTQVEKIVRADLAEKAVGHKLDLVETLIDRGNPADITEAVTLGREELEHRPSADTRIQLARALYRSGARAEAMTQVHAALATGVRDARLYELAARLEDEPRKSLYSREAAKVDPGNWGWRALGLEPRAKP